MILTNNFALPIFWRTFNAGDTVYIVGHRDGWIDPGAAVDYSHPHGSFQIEIKSGAAGHPFLRRAGEVYQNDSELIILPDGQLKRIEETLEIEPDAGEKSENLGSVSNFFDKLAFDGDTTDEITTTISNTTTTSSGSGMKATTSSAAEMASGIGGEVTAKIPIKTVELGVKFSGNVSQKVVHGTSDELTGSYGITFANSQTAVRKTPILVKGRKVTVIHWTWARTYRTGRTKVGSSTYEWEVTTGMEASYRLEQYDSLAAMPPAVFAAYREKYPATGLSFLRPETPMLVDGNGWLGLWELSMVQPDGALTGTVYGNPMTGAWMPAAGELEFTRRINPDFEQDWEGNVQSDTQITGLFRQRVNGMPEPAQYSWTMSRSLAVNGNGHLGELVIDNMAPDGTLTGTIYGDPITGAWDQGSAEISFTRRTADPSYTQQWRGTRTGPLSFAGTFEERMNGNASGSFSWSMQPG